MRKAGACVSLASASVSPASWTGPPLALDHPPLCASGTEGRLCNQHLPPVQGPPMPLGHYTLVAFFVLDTTASGVCNAHAVADFSPDTSLPADWVRMRDPFQGASKKSFGFTLTVSAGPASGSPSSAAAPHPAAVRRTIFMPDMPDTCAPRRLQPEKRERLRKVTHKIIRIVVGPTRERPGHSELMCGDRCVALGLRVYRSPGGHACPEDI